MSTTFSDLANSVDPEKGTALIGTRQPLSGAAGRTQQDKNLDTLSPADFKFASDASDTQSIQRLIDRLSESDVHGKVVRLGGKHYVCNTPIRLKDGLTLDGEGATLDFRGVPHQARTRSMYAAATTGDETPLNADAEPGAVVLRLPAGLALSPNDLIKVYSDSRFDDRTGTRVGELQIVRSYDSASGFLSLSVPLAYGYAVSEGAKIIQIHSLKNIRVLNTNFLGPQISNEIGQAWCLSIYGAVSPLISGCTFSGTSYAEVLLIDCLRGRILGNDFHGTDQNNALGYGISFANASRDCLAQGNTFFDKRHFYSTNNLAGYGIEGAAAGVVFNCSFLNGKMHRATWFDIAETSSGDAMDTHAASDWITFEGNTVFGSVGTGLNIEGANSIVRNNHFDECERNACVVKNHTHHSGSLLFEGNIIRNCKGRGLLVTKDADSGKGGFSFVTVRNSIFSNVGTESTSAVQIGIARSRVGSDNQVPRVLVTGLQVDAIGTALEITGTENGAMIADCDLRGAGRANAGVMLISRVPGALVNNLRIEATGANTTGMYCASTANSILGNLRVYSPGGSQGYGIIIQAFAEMPTDNLMIHDSRIDGFEKAGSLAPAVSYASIRNLNLRGCTSGFELGAGNNNTAADIIGP
ncbi:hypothetical protein ANK1_3470 [plant metagenome]|uniref:Right handed beta helix domain-containing protein n=1 Tax=plant metagenome TaxID=1297885 RepID=A0A484P9M0_9ZZZZ